MINNWHDYGYKNFEQIKHLITMHKNNLTQKINIIKDDYKNNNNSYCKIVIVSIVASMLFMLANCSGGLYKDNLNNQNQLSGDRSSKFIAFSIFQKPKKIEKLSLQEIRQRAFLDTIAYAEGSKWDICYGGYKANYANKSYPCPRRKLNGITSSAFGAFQILDTTWRANADKDCKSNYNKLCQIKIANKLLKNGGISKLVKTGKITHAIYKSSRIWASMPTSRGKSAYGQPSHKVNKLLGYYNHKVNLYTKKQGGLA